MAVFVGRRQEMAAVTAALDATTAGRGGLVLISGEPGIGKTRLAGELVALARDRGLPAWWGRCPDTEGAPPYWPWVQVVRDIGPVPETLAPLTGDVPAAAGDDGARFRLFDALARHLMEAGPGVVVLDDLQWADRGSLELLELLVPRLGASTILLVATYRDVDDQRGSHLDRALGAVASKPGTVSLQLAGLREADIGELVGLTLGDEASSDTAAMVARRSEGNPFFATEIARLLATEGTGVAVPPGVRQVLRRRLDTLGPGVDEILTTAALLGRTFEQSVVAAVHGADVDAALAAARRAALLAEEPGRFGWWRFSHDLVRETLVDDLGTTRRVHLHGQLATALESVHSDDPDWTAAIAHHAIAAAPAGDTGRAFRWARAAGDQMLARYAHKQAVGFYQDALRWLDASPDPPNEARCDLLIGLGKAQLGAGDTWSSRDTLLAAAELAGDDLDRRCQALCSIGRWFSGAGAFAVPAELLRDTLARLGDEQSARRGQVLYRLAANVVADPDETRALLQEAAELALALGDAALRFDTLLYWYLALPFPERRRRTAEFLPELVAVAEQLDEPGQRVFAEWIATVDLAIRVGDGHRIGPAAERMRALVDQSGSGILDLTIRLGELHLQVLQGHFDQARGLTRKALRGERTPFDVEWPARWLLRRERDDLVNAVDRLAAHVGVFEHETMVVTAALALSYADLGRFDEVWTLVDAALAPGVHGLVNDIAYGEFALALLAETCASVQHRDGASLVYETLLPLAGSDMGRELQVSPNLGSVDLYLGMCAATLGRLDDAERHYGVALDFNERLGARPYLARTNYWWARLCAERGDRDRALRLATRARTQASDLGMTLLAGQVEAFLHEHRPVGSAPAQAPFVGRDRELDQLRRVLAEARAGRGTVGLVGGEPGIGKTRLVGELTDVAAAEGVPVAWGRCPEDGAPPFWPWAQVLRTLGLAGDDLAPVMGAAGTGAPDLGARFELWQAVAAAVTGAGPAVIVLDDAQWADPASLDLLRHLAPSLADSPVLVLVTYRDVEVVKGHPLSEVIAELVRVPRAVRIGLGALPAEAVTDLAAAAGVSEGDAATIAARSEGNPFFAEELIRLAAGGGSVEVPGGVREVIRRRVERLGTDADEVLTTAAVLGRDVELALLDAVTGSSTEPVLERARAVGLLAEDPERFGWWEFSHDLVRETLYDDLGTTRRVRLHDRVATALEALHGDDPAWLSALAHHAVAAAPAGDAGRAVRWAEAAADDAAARLSYDDAARLYQAALDWLARSPDAGDDLHRCDLLTGLGLSYDALSRAVQAQRALIEAAQLAGDDGERLVRAVASLGRGFIGGYGTLGIPSPILERGLAVVGEESPQRRAELLMKYAMNLMVEGRATEGRAHLDDALRLARAAGDLDTLTLTVCMHWAYQPRRARVADTITVRDEVRRLFDAADTAAALDARSARHAIPRRRLAMGYHHRFAFDFFADVLYGDLEGAVHDAEAAIAHADAVRNATWASVMRNCLGITLVLRGDLVEAEQLLRSMHTVDLASSGLEAGISRERGEPGRARGLIGPFVEIWPVLAKGLDTVVALLSAEEGDLDAARQGLDRSLARGVQSMDSFGFGDLALCAAAELAALLGDASAARLLYDELLVFEGLQAGFYTALWFPGAGDLYLGMCAATMGRLDDAERHYAAALDVNGRMGARPYVARTKLWWARLCAERDEHGRARQLAREANLLADELGMALVARQAAELAGDRVSRSEPSNAHTEVASARHEDGTVTLVFADIASSTEITARMGDKAWAATLAEQTALLRDLAEAHGGYLVKAMGDGFMLAFGSARRALDCVAAVQHANAGGPVALRVGVHTGEAVRVDGDYIGHHVNVASRIAGAAEPGEVLVSAIVHAITSSAGDIAFGPARRLTLRGIAEPVVVHRLRAATEEDEPTAPVGASSPDGDGIGHSLVDIDTPLVGRARELATATAVLDRALAGQGGLLLLTGEPGIGKTRLATEVARLAAERGAEVHWGRCWDGDGAPAFWPWTQVLRSVVDRHGRNVVGRHAPSLQRLVPELSEHTPAELADGEGDADRFGVFDAIASTVQVMTRERPVVLVLDDVQWADASSMDALRHVADFATRSRLLVVATARPTGALAAIERMATTIAVDRLGAAAVDELVASSGDVPPATLARIRAVAGGNPFFVTSIVQSGDTDIPDSVRGLVRRQLESLPRPSVEVLELASVIGREVTTAQLEAVSDLARPELLDALDAAASSGALRWLDRPGTRIAFAHDLVRETVYDDLPHRRRAELHGRVGSALARLYGDDPATVAQVAHHTLAAGDDPLAAAGLARKAADGALSQLAYDEAAGWYRRAREVLETSRMLEPRQRAELLLEEGQALRAVISERAGGVLGEAAAAAEACGDTELLAQVVIAWVFRPGGWRAIPRALRAHLDAALASLPAGDSPLRAQLLAAAAVDDGFRNKPTATELVDEAMAMALRLQDGRSILRAHDAIRVARLWRQAPHPGWADEVLVAADAHYAAGTALQDAHATTAALWDRGAALLTIGDLQGVRRVTTELERAPFGRTLMGRMFDDLFIAALAGLRGDFAVVEASVSGWSAREFDDIDEMAGVGKVVVRFMFEFVRGRDGLAWWPAEIARATGSMPRSAYVDAVSAVVLARTGQTERAREFIRNPPPYLLRMPWTVGRTAAAFLAEACVELDEGSSVAAEVYDWLAPIAGELLFTDGCGWVVLGSVDHFLGLYATVLGRHDDAERHFADAQAIEARLDAHHLVARTRFRWAQLAARRGDETRARELIDACVATTRRLGMDDLTERAETLLETLGAAAAPEAAAALEAEAPPARTASVGAMPGRRSAATFRQEGEFWTVAFEGRTARLKDTKGMGFLARLLARPGQEVHALDLAGGGGSADELDRGDSGAVLDPKAKEAYRRRLTELAEDLEEARANNDLARAEQAELEIDALTDQLSAAVGLGGRDRKAASQSERARVAATRGIRTAMERIARAHEPLGRHLAATVRTGTYCVYEPDPRVPTQWEL